MSQTSPETFMTTDEKASQLRIHPYTLTKHARNGKIAGFRVGKQWRFAPDAVPSDGADEVGETKPQEDN